MIRAARPRQHGTSEEHDVTDSAVVPQGNSALRLALLFAIGLNLAMIAIRVATYRPLLAMPGSLGYVLEPAGLLVAYAGIVVWATRRAGPLRQTVLEVGLRVGLLTGGLQIVHLAIEMFAPLSGSANAITLLSFMFGTFLIWGFAGFSSVRRTGSVGHGAAAGSWAAMVCMVSVLLFGFALMFSPYPRLEDVASWAEFERSRWTDVRAFAIANSLDSGISHLAIGPMVGAIFGGIAGLLERLGKHRQPSTATDT